MQCVMEFVIFYKYILQYNQFVTEMYSGTSSNPCQNNPWYLTSLHRKMFYGHDIRGDRPNLVSKSRVEGGAEMDGIVKSVIIGETHRAGDLLNAKR